MIRRHIIGMSLFILILFSLITVFSQSNNDVAFNLERISRATVFIIQASANDFDTHCVGSGTIVRFDGLILTNAHNVAPSEACPGTELIIAMAVNPDEPPVPKYRASIAQLDVGLDLALLRIDRELDGRRIDPAALPVLPFVEIVDSNTVVLDETLVIVGFPDLGNSAAANIRSSVASFVAEPRGGEKSWMKVSSNEAISGFISGGGAYNQAGQLVGVPTSAPITVGTAGDCLLLEDTNADGFINENDACVPSAAGISVIRPANFARPLIRSASLGLRVENLSATTARVTISDAPRVERLYFSTSVNNNLPTQVVNSVPAGTTSLYLFFDYFNFTEDSVYEVRVSVDGVPSQIFSLPPVRWSGSANGLWHIGSSGQPFPNGVYEFRVLVNGIVVGNRQITIGGVATESPNFSNVVFGLLDENGNLQGESYILPQGDTVYARFIYRNMAAGLNWTYRWYYNGVPFEAPQGDIITWGESDGINGAEQVAIRPDNLLRAGNYRFELYLYVDNTPRLQTVGDFVVAGTAEGVLPNVFGDIEFYRATTALAEPSVSASNSYPDGAHTLYARFDWQRIAIGTQWTMQWLVDGGIFYEQTQAWNTAEDGQDFSLRLSTPNGLPDGTYTLNLLINGVLLRSETVSVGIGQLAINRFERTGGTDLRGRIVDADTGLGISGATFVLISEDYSIADFAWDANQVYALAVTDINGRFEIDRPLALDAPYSVYIVAEGYLAITADGFLIDAETLEEEGSPIEMYIPLTKD